MPTTIPVPQDESPRGPQPTPGIPDRSQDKPATPRIQTIPSLIRHFYRSATPPAWLEERVMSTDDTNATPEQKNPKDVHRPPGQSSPADERSKAPPMVQPAGSKDASERPVVNPVTGGKL